MSAWKYTVHRVMQMDSVEIEKQVFALLVDQIAKGIPEIFRKYEPELVMLLRLITFRFSVWKSGMTYGASLLGLVYRDERKHWDHPDGPHAELTVAQRLGWAFGHIILKYIHDRLQRISIQQRWADLPEDNLKKRVWKLMEFTEKWMDILTFLNFVVFLRNGKYYHLVDRLICARLVYVQKRMNPPHDMEFLNRQVVWQTFTEFVLFFMSIVSFQSLTSRLSKLLPLKRSKENELPPHMCAICNSTTISTPHITNCGHTYCYYCIKSNMMSDAYYACPRCRKQVEYITRTG